MCAGVFAGHMAGQQMQPKSMSGGGFQLPGGGSGMRAPQMPPTRQPFPGQGPQGAGPPGLSQQQMQNREARHARQDARGQAQQMQQGMPAHIRTDLAGGGQPQDWSNYQAKGGDVDNYGNHYTAGPGGQVFGTMIGGTGPQWGPKGPSPFGQGGMGSYINQINQGGGQPQAPQGGGFLNNPKFNQGQGGGGFDQEAWFQQNSPGFRPPGMGPPPQQQPQLMDAMYRGPGWGSQGPQQPQIGLQGGGQAQQMMGPLSNMFNQMGGQMGGLGGKIGGGGMSQMPMQPQQPQQMTSYPMQPQQPNPNQQPFQISGGGYGQPHSSSSNSRRPGGSTLPATEQFE